MHGHRHVAMPEGWNKIYARLSPSKDQAVHRGAMALAVIFNDSKAIAALHKLVADPIGSIGAIGPGAWAC